MPRNAIALGSLLLALAAQALAQGQDDLCKSRMTPSPSLLKRIDQATSRYKGSAALAPKNLLDAGTLWTCSKDHEQICCHDIPLTLVLDSSGNCAVAFPYGELTIKRDHGNFKPLLKWVLSPAANPPTYVFGTDGIEIVPTPGWTPPVNKGDKCLYDGSFDSHHCKANGKNKAKAGHLANVFPVGKVDLPAFRCGNIDPTISNTN